MLGEGPSACQLLRVLIQPGTWGGQSGGKSFYRRRGLHAETAQSGLTVILKLVISGLICVILIVLSTLKSSVPGSVCSHFLEANSQNCDTLCHG